ncbi:DMT family transporter [Anaeromyxobacter oryzae]|uniref:Membrane protein n=1 Tax=Anaeromyxobacter oryzae TaxID=2918170 RepID=A0ABM7WPX1_9BACT|nr:DMT family transporter [Anaeromyxobacter oryzae]BDG01519.1 membrane protein [Anaeromyxobacter oryzae]
MTRRGWILFLALGVIWGVPYLLIKVAVRELTPASLVFLRTALGAVLLLPVVIRHGNLRALLAHWRPIALFTVVEMGIPWLLLSHAEQHVTSSLAGLFMASVPLVGGVLARVTGGHEPLGVRRSVGLVVGLAGVVALLGLDLGRGDTLAIVALAIVALGYAVGPMIISRRLADLPVLDVVAASLALCAIGYAPAGLAQLPATMPALDVIGAVVVLGVACTAVAFLLFFRLIAEVGPVRATVITYVNPAVAVAAGVALLGEPFTLGTGAGFVLILAGSWLATGPASVGSGAAEPGETVAAE